MKREIRDPIYYNDDKSRIAVKFYFPAKDTTTNAIVNKDLSNPDWIEIHENFTEAAIEENTKKHLEELETAHKFHNVQQEAAFNADKKKMLFEMKSEILSIPELLKDSNKEIRKRIRKSDKPEEIRALAAACIAKSL